MPDETLSDQIRRAIADSGLSLYRIAKASNVDAAALTRFMQGTSLTLTSVDRLAEVLGFEIVIKNPAETARVDPHGQGSLRRERCRPTTESAASASGRKSRGKN